MSLLTLESVWEGTVDMCRILPNFQKNLESDAAGAHAHKRRMFE